jgi:hypothetical protein
MSDIYATHWVGDRKSSDRKTRPVSPRAERAMIARALKDYHELRVEMDRRWDANRARYGHAEPAYIKPESFTPEHWALYVAERPGAVNVVAWREKQVAGIRTEPEARPESQTAERQGLLF